MSKTMDAWVSKGNERHGWLRTDDIWVYGTKEMRDGRDLGIFCANTWTRKTGIKVERGFPKHIQIIFKEIADEDA